MQQVEDRIFLAAGLIAGRRIDRDPALLAQGGAVVPATGHGTVRHGIHTVQIACPTFDDENVVDRSHITIQIDIVRVCCLHSIHNEAIAIQFRRQWFRGCIFPNALFPLDQVSHSRSFRLAERRLNHRRRQEISNHLHTYGFGSQKTECHLIVRMNLR